MIIQTFFKLGQVLVDNSYSTNKGHEKFNIIRDGEENIFKALRHKKGMILIGAHIGAWMIASKFFEIDKKRNENYPKVNIVEFHVGQGHNASNKIDARKLNYINSMEDAPIFKINQSLNQNEIVIFMADRPVDQNIELVPFFGRLAPIDTAAFKIALTKKALISFSFGFKGSDMDYHFFITPPIDPENLQHSEKHEAIIALAIRYTQALEDYLKNYPTQWFNFYPFWSALSPENLSELSKKSKSHLI